MPEVMKAKTLQSLRSGHFGSQQVQKKDEIDSLQLVAGTILRRRTGRA